jgi:perosamine synthetase
MNMTGQSIMDGAGRIAHRADRYAPCATRSIPYARQWIDEEDIQSVVEVLRSDWLTTGPKVAEFEKAIAGFVGAEEAVAVSSGTAALHAAMYAIGIGPGDEVILSPMTFVATANAVVFQGGIPIFADVDPDTLLIDPNEVERKISPRTKAVIAVDYAGQPCDYDSLGSIARHHGLFLIADACHSLGAEYKGRNVGTLADLTIFSFHPVKHITTGEGGMITTDVPALAERMRLFRNHGITRDPEKFVHACPPDGRRGSPLTIHHTTTNNQEFSTVNGQWYYEMQDLGYNYRITDIQCALGLSQLKKLPEFIRRRCEIAAKYDETLADIPGIEPLGLRPDVLSAKQAVIKAQSLDRKLKSDLQSRNSKVETRNSQHAYHLYVVKADFNTLGTDRVTLFQSFYEKGIGLNVHYIPVHLQPFYKNKFNTGSGLCPAAEAAYKSIISLPLFPGMRDDDVQRVIIAVTEKINK